MVLNLLLESRMTAVLVRLRTGPQMEIYVEWTKELFEDEEVCRVDVFSTNNTSP